MMERNVVTGFLFPVVVIFERDRKWWGRRKTVREERQEEEREIGIKLINK